MALSDRLRGEPISEGFACDPIQGGEVGGQGAELRIDAGGSAGGSMGSFPETGR